MPASVARVLVALLACGLVACGEVERVYYDDLDGGEGGPHVSASHDATSVVPEEASPGSDGQGPGEDGSPEDAAEDSGSAAGGDAESADASRDAPESPDALESDGAVERDGSSAEAGDASSDGAADSGRDGGDAGCGPLDTVLNCGACGAACDTTHSLGASCDGTTCSYTGCVSGYADCNTAAPDTNGCETPTDTIANCSGCNLACDTSTSTGASCNGTTCSYTGCATGYADCNTTAPNTGGCETSITTTSNCSGCGLACDTLTSVGATCTGTTCQYTGCVTGYADCITTAPDTNGCETAIDTTSNCGGCNVACGTQNVASAGCNGTACTYTCESGYVNCDTAAPNTGGCACHTPECCVGGDAGVGGSVSSTGAPGATCETTHSNGPASGVTDGFGEAWYDCSPLGTYDATEALSACLAWPGSDGRCEGGWTCPGPHGTTVTQPVICDDNCTYCWAYQTTTGEDAVTAGDVYDCTCPGDVLGTWQ